MKFLDIHSQVPYMIEQFLATKCSLLFLFVEKHATFRCEFELLVLHGFGNTRPHSKIMFKVNAKPNPKQAKNEKKIV